MTIIGLVAGAGVPIKPVKLSHSGGGVYFLILGLSTSWLIGELLALAFGTLNFVRLMVVLFVWLLSIINCYGNAISSIINKKE